MEIGRQVGGFRTSLLPFLREASEYERKDLLVLLSFEPEYEFTSHR
jgi:hypothetical protein